MSTPESTLEYRRIFPLAVQSISPKLSAAHATRAKLLNAKEGHAPSPASSSNVSSGSTALNTKCDTCGYILLSGFTSRAKNQNHKLSKITSSNSSLVTKKYLRRCPNCRVSRKLTGPHAGSSSFPAVRRMKQPSTTSPIITDTPLLSSSPPTSITPSPLTSVPTSPTPQSDPPTPNQPDITKNAKTAPQGAPKARPKKNTGLQAMLARNRMQKEKNEAEAKHRGGGLANFLVDL
ncbi:hypothetical protein DL93DRAFT_2165990 [Clavulina sp. PMI_390]|nr:hypothetical protein DL93DRAFT_2165990 [Clavulina sp. PMI_390]